jgi:hypothetical protein
MAMGDGGHHARLGGVGDFCGSNDHVCCLRLHSHEETKSLQTGVDSATRRVYLITMILLRERSVCGVGLRDFPNNDRVVLCNTLGL